jgi:uncharacterized membrane protein YqaE (UPF0057 family)
MSIGYLLLKFSLSAAVLVAVSEIAKRSSVWAALVASLPLTSLLAFVWLYVDTKDTQKVAALSNDIFWLVIPSLALFPALAVLLRSGVTFWLAMAGAIALTLLAYAATVYALSVFSPQG